MNALADELSDVAASPAQTPYRAFLVGAAVERYTRIRTRLNELAGPPLVRLATSVKTNPDPKLLAVARQHGAYAEVISPGELALALQNEFNASEIVYNGPFRL
ncbi:MAG: hypothetical protein M3R44_02400, partial [Candidatus Eremiobacteraeota bacterium]|nr:hypothetical protein [Candidatus Eremiobacteraeota bacterium]